MSSDGTKLQCSTSQQHLTCFKSVISDKPSTITRCQSSLPSLSMLWHGW